ncbi:hypothetical protein ACFFGH_32380 [Lysobacter korlensis]|uniref:DUF3885 domain-containing protein n=1 Tax=Lysobacter korlensis TaxID=553636 RepID=A0ABV6S358_9GAMM
MQESAVELAICELVELDGDDLYDQMIWIDWRSFESEVIDSFSERLPAEDRLGYTNEETPTAITYRGKAYRNPLTSTPSDRYVTIFSIAEILKPEYHIYTEKESCDGDTHGFFLFTDAEFSELCTEHAAWVKDRLRPLALGIDGFSGFNIPYFGNESHGDPDLAQKFERLHTKMHARHERLLKKITEQLEGKRPFWKFW